MAVSVAAVGCGGGAHGDGRVTLSAHAASALADAPVRIDVHGLRAHERATLRATWTAFGGAVWSSSVPERADAGGAITLRGIDGMRFLWSMRPSHPRGRNVSAFLPPAAGATGVALSLAVGAQRVARTRLARRITPGSVNVRALTRRRDGVVGFLFSPPGRARRPAALVFGGSEGGNGMIDVAGLLAAHGYPALALAYFGERGLPARLENIPLEYFARAARLLRRQPGVDPARVVAVGASRGGEAALLLASTFPYAPARRDRPRPQRVRQPLPRPRRHPRVDA